MYYLQTKQHSFAHFWQAFQEIDDSMSEEFETLGKLFCNQGNYAQLCMQECSFQIHVKRDKAVNWQAFQEIDESTQKVFKTRGIFDTTKNVYATTRI